MMKGTSSRESRRPPDVTCGAAILDDTIQDGGAGNDDNQDLIPKPEMRSSKMATGSGRAAIYRRRNGDRKVLPMLFRGHT